MPGKVRIVTDSSAQFIDPSVIRRYNITIVPLDIQIGSDTLREGVDIDAETFFNRVNNANTNVMPELVAPTAERFLQTYQRLNRETDQVLSLHLSRAIHPTWQRAKDATQMLLGRCEIAVVDSQTTSVGLAMLAEAAAKFAEQYTH